MERVEEEEKPRRGVNHRQIQSHHFGFGNNEIERLGQIQNKATGLQASGKFQEKLMRK